MPISYESSSRIVQAKRRRTHPRSVSTDDSHLLELNRRTCTRNRYNIASNIHNYLSFFAYESRKDETREHHHSPLHIMSASPLETEN
jgi:hypothetical protein